MFSVTKAEAAAIRDAFHQRGELSTRALARPRAPWGTSAMADEEQLRRNRASIPGTPGCARREISALTSARPSFYRDDVFCWIPVFEKLPPVTAK
jgi:hypothetical protein